MAAISFESRVVVNGVEIITNIEFQGAQEIHRFPELYKVDKLGRTSMWRIYVIGDEYHRESGILGGKVKTYGAVKATPKNVGRANETTAENQALFEAFSEWKHKKKQLYTEETPENGGGQVEKAGVGERMRPMLAEKYTERKEYAKFPGAASPKLDGVRVMSYTEEKFVKLISRLGKFYEHMNGIREEAKIIYDKFPGVVLDGELYSHNIPFNAISGAVRAKTKPSKFDDILEFYVFDLYLSNNPKATYEERAAKMREMCSVYDFKRIRFLFYEIVNNEEELSQKHNEYVAAGYEGLIFRNLDGVYRLGRRVNDLLKYKEFADEEFKVVDVLEGSGTEKGAAVFVCQTKDGKQTFNVRPRGSIEKRQIQFKNKAKYIGKMLTVRYQPLSKEEVLPRFPVGIKFDPKTEELIAVGLRNYE